MATVCPLERLTRLVALTVPMAALFLCVDRALSGICEVVSDPVAWCLCGTAQPPLLALGAAARPLVVEAKVTAYEPG